MSELPKGWVESTISEITSYVQRGKGPKYSEEVNSFPVINQKAIRWFGVQEEHLKYVKPDTWASYTEERFVRSGDILWNSTGTGTIGRACLLNEKEAAKAKVVDSHVTILRVNSAVEPRYLFYWIRSPKIQFDIESLSTGTTNQVELSKTKVLETKIPLAPLNEQKRIADKLDSILTKVDFAQARLEKIPGILKRFRQSVLAAATSGELTKDWRGESGSYAINDKYNAPSSWELYTFHELIELVTSGSRGWASFYSDRGSIFIRAQNINSDYLNLSDVAYVDLPEKTEGRRTKVERDSLLITITGANVTKSARVETDLSDAYVSQHVALIKLKNNQYSSFIDIFLKDENSGRGQLLELAYGGGKPGLNLSNIKNLKIALPLLDEQNEISRRVRRLFAMADNVGSKYKNVQAKVNSLSQAALAKAFRGELVLQDSNDEPAEKLLEGIRNTKSSSTSKKK